MTGQLPCDEIIKLWAYFKLLCELHSPKTVTNSNATNWIATDYLAGYYVGIALLCSLQTPFSSQIPSHQASSFIGFIPLAHLQEILLDCVGLEERNNTFLSKCCFSFRSRCLLLGDDEPFLPIAGIHLEVLQNISIPCMQNWNVHSRADGCCIITWFFVFACSRLSWS